MQRWRAERLYKNVFNARFSCESFSMWLIFTLLCFNNLLFRLRINFFGCNPLQNKVCWHHFLAATISLHVSMFFRCAAGGCERCESGANAGRRRPQLPEFNL